MNITIYIAGPYTGNVGENVQRAVHAYHQLADMGFYPFCPHQSLILELHKPRDYEFWLNQCFEWVRRCDAVYRLPQASPGADREVALAKELGKPVFHCFDSLLKWRNPNGWGN